MRSLRRLPAVLRTSAPILAMLLHLSCSSGDSVTETPAQVARVELTAPKQALVVGESVQLTATPFSPEGNPMGARPVTFVSDHPEVLSVDGSGRARGVSRGSATVTATSGGVSGILALTVSRAPAIGLAPDTVSFSARSPGPNPASQTVQVTNTGDGSISGLATQVTYAAGQPTGWLSAQLGGGSAPATLTLQASRGSLAVGTYRATVAVSAPGATGQSLAVSFVISAAPVASVRVSPDTATLAVGGNVTLTATTTDSAGNVLTGRTITWLSSDTTVATVAGNGSTATVTGRAHGQATITATSEGRSGSATVRVPSFTLTVTGAGAGSGTVTSAPAGISCAVSGAGATGACQHTFDAGIVVRLTAQPSGGGSFTGFGGACSGTSCQLTITADATVSAAFALPVFTIATSSNPAAGGTTSGAGSYTSGQTVTVTATPATGYRFTSWTEAGTQVSTQASYSFIASVNRNLVANFTLIAQRTLTVTGTGTGAGTVTSTPAGINCTIAAGVASGTCQATFRDSTAVALTAAAKDSSSTFAGFSGSCTGTTCTLAMTADRAVTANFAVTTVTVTTTSNPVAGGTTTGAGTYAPGSSVTVTATAGAGYSFGNWTQAGAVVSSQPSYTFTLGSSNMALVANFLAFDTLSLGLSGTALGSVTVNGQVFAYTGTPVTRLVAFQAGTMLTLQAAASTGLNFFSGWTGACTGLSAGCSLTLTQNATVGASFDRATMILTASADTICNAGTKCVNPVRDTLTATVRGQTGAAVVFATTSGTQIASVTSHTTSQDASGITLYTYTATLSATALPAGTYSVVASTSSGGDSIQSSPITIVIGSR